MLRCELPRRRRSLLARRARRRIPRSFAMRSTSWRSARVTVVFVEACLGKLFAYDVEKARGPCLRERLVADLWLDPRRNGRVMLCNDLAKERGFLSAQPPKGHPKESSYRGRAVGGRSGIAQTKPTLRAEAVHLSLRDRSHAPCFALAGRGASDNPSVAFLRTIARSARQGKRLVRSSRRLLPRRPADPPRRGPAAYAGTRAQFGGCARV
jgi:hypothetical protein